MLKSLKKLDFLVPIVFILILFAFAYRTLLSSPMLAMVDLPAFPLHGEGEKFLRDFISPWQYGGLGRAGDTGYREVVYAVLGLLSNNNGEVTQKVYYLSLLLIASMSMYFLIGRLGVRSRIARFIGACVYGINPITIGQFAGAPGQLITIALLPLVLVAVFDILGQQKTIRARGMLLLATTTAIIISFNI